jgi:hypothetical protein
MNDVRWVALILLGAGETDLEGTIELCASIFHYEPHTLAVTINCDSVSVAERAASIQFLQDPRIHLITAPPKHPVSIRGKYLGPNVLFALNYIASNHEAEFVLKLDADSLIIGPMAERIAGFLATHSDCGVCGTLGRTSARQSPTYGYERTIISPLVRMIRALPSEQWAYIESLADDELLSYANHDSSTANNLRTCATLAKPVAAAMQHGYYWLEYCQGGGYALSWNFLTALKQAGYLAHSPKIFSLPTGEDVLISMYCRSLRFTVLDYSADGQPFACAWKGLPDSPKSLLERNHSVVHSLKGDIQISRADLQAFFKSQRAAASF